MRSEMKKRKLEFSSHPGNLALMRNFVRHFLDNMPLSERDRTLMVLGVDEACTNIIRHAYELRDDKLIALSLEIRDDCVRMRLRDYGMQPPVEALHRRRRRDGVIRPGGLGLMMIRNAFDQVDYILRRRGTELVLTKKIARRQVVSCVPSGSMLSDFLELDHEPAGIRCCLRSLAATANVQRVHRAEEGLRKVGTFGGCGKKAP